MLDWQPGPAQGNDPLADETVECGDRFLVAMPCLSWRNRIPYWDTAVIVATEIDWDDSNGDTWGSRSWHEVEWFIRLDKSNLPPLRVRAYPELEEEE